MWSRRTSEESIDDQETTPIKLRPSSELSDKLQQKKNYFPFIFAEILFT